MPLSSKYYFIFLIAISFYYFYFVLNLKNLNKFNAIPDKHLAVADKNNDFYNDQLNFDPTMLLYKTPQ